MSAFKSASLDARHSQKCTYSFNVRGSSPDRLIQTCTIAIVSSISFNSGIVHIKIKNNFCHRYGVESASVRQEEQTLQSKRGATSLVDSPETGHNSTSGRHCMNISARTSWGSRLIGKCDVSPLGCCAVSLADCNPLFLCFHLASPIKQSNDETNLCVL